MPPQKIRVAVLPAEIEVSITKLSQIQSSAPKLSPEAQKARIAQAMNIASRQITAALEKDIGASYFFSVIPATKTAQALQNAGITSFSKKLSAKQAAGLGKILDAQALVLVDVAGYGTLKKKWLFYLLGSGLIEGLTQGIIVNAAVSNPWAAVGVGVEEAAQETAEWTGGFYVFNWAFTPVVLEARMISPFDGSILWSKTAIAARNPQAVKALAKKDRRKRELRLKVVADKAVRILAKSLNSIAWRNLKNARPNLGHTEK